MAGELLAEEGVPAAEGSDGTSVEQCLSAKFHFVDLAGSEKAGKTGNRGERFKGQLKIVIIMTIIVLLTSLQFSMDCRSNVDYIRHIRQDLCSLNLSVLYL